MKYILSQIYELIYRKFKKDNSFILDYKRPKIIKTELNYTENKFGEFKLKNNESKKISLLFFYISDKKDKTDKLCKELIEIEKYKILHKINAPSQYSFIAGISEPIAYNLKDLLSWTEFMVNLGFTFDCEFDGWKIENENNIQDLNNRVESYMEEN